MVTETQDFLGPNAPRADLEAFWEWHENLIHTFVHKHPSLTHIEVPLDETSGRKMEEAFGTPARCWGHFNKQKKIGNAQTVNFVVAPFSPS